MKSMLAVELVAAARALARATAGLRFSAGITHVYQPLDYAWRAHEVYLRKFGRTRKRVLFLGMNPGPFGMAQTGVPFGDVAMVHDWLGVHAKIDRPRKEHPRRPVLGFSCPRAEVSGTRLWQLFRKRYQQPARFFRRHFVANYCPLAFVNARGGNVTPDKLGIRFTTDLFHACDTHLVRIVQILEPEWVIGVGEFARRRADAALFGKRLKIGQILHPSPASPAANRDWAGQATRQLQTLGIW
jgi:single-strand selective monofunctional uracil DNA glycosylase